MIHREGKDWKYKHKGSEEQNCIKHKVNGPRCTWKSISPKEVSIGVTEVTMEAGETEMEANYSLWHLFSPWNIKPSYFLKHKSYKNRPEI